MKNSGGPGAIGKGSASARRGFAQGKKEKKRQCLGTSKRERRSVRRSEGKWELSSQSSRGDPLTYKRKKTWSSFGREKESYVLLHERKTRRMRFRKGRHKPPKEGKREAQYVCVGGLEE